MMDSRPNPDTLLSRLQQEENHANRGKLKVFLGYAAGVGKTYSMLEAAQQRRQKGIDVAIGVIETHGRTETEALLQDLEIVPRQLIEYRGVILTEMDVDAILARRPQLVLVDELAHTNSPGSRHPKRYQDVEEILTAGIDVYTTLNIQHVESLNDIVFQITGIKVRETLPDSVIDEASEIELIDLPPEELLVRLQDGKVYVPEQASRAIQKFFRKGNLTALRELTMRRAAERVDNQMRTYMQTQAIPGPWAAADRILVCIGPGLISERLVRVARRLSGELNADWEAVFVEPPGFQQASPELRQNISKMSNLIAELGGRLSILPGDSVADTIIEYARQHNFTKIVAGKTLRSKWQALFHHSILERMIYLSGDIDIYVVSTERDLTALKISPSQHIIVWRNYLLGLLATVIATAVCSMIHLYIDPTNLVMIYLLTVLFTAASLGRGPSIMVSALSVLFFDFFYVPPHLTFAVSDTQYILTFIGLFGVGLSISELTARVREQAAAAKQREADTASLYSLSRDLSAAQNLDEIIHAVVHNIIQTFGRDAIVFLPDSASPGSLTPFTDNPDYHLDANENAVAVWAFRNQQEAGRGTNTLSAAEGCYIPLKSTQGIVGVLGVKPKEPTSHLSLTQRQLLFTFASQAALAIERVQFSKKAQKAIVLQETERLQTALLNSISHDLRTPLSTITGALSSLNDLQKCQLLDSETQQNLLENALGEAERLNLLVGNLLNMTRIEAGAMKINLEPGDIQDVIGSAIEQVASRMEAHKVVVTVPDQLPWVAIDFVLMVQVLVNILDNSIKYSQPDSPIEITAQVVSENLEIRISDHGPGIPPEDLERIFDKFFRVKRPGRTSGAGLGLSICRGIVEAHYGKISAENRETGGASFIILLPIGQPSSSFPPGNSKHETE